MAIRNATPTTFRPLGVSDAIDGTNTFSGSLQSASNIIPSEDTKSVWQPRAAAVLLTNFSAFVTNPPGFIAASLVVGDIEYGLVSLNVSGTAYDAPYAYNLASGAFITVNGGVFGSSTPGMIPTSVPSTGDWTPPIMAVVGTRIVICHPNFPGGLVKFGWIDISSFTATISCSVAFNSTTITSATNLLQAGVQPGQKVTIPGWGSSAQIISVAADGLSVVIDNAPLIFTGTYNVTFAGGTPSAPLWYSGDTNINALPSVPVGVAQFNGRAYFACGANGVAYSDALLPCNRTNATQALTFANGLATTAIAGLPLSSPISGGIVQALIVFQGLGALWQITGDQATSNLTVNSMNVSTGTLAPLSIVPTTIGLAFMSPDGLRVIDFSGRVSNPIGANGDGVSIPFIYASHPSRICAAANADLIRISTQNGYLQTAPNQEYWYHISEKIWSGPHTFPASLIQPWRDSFVVHPVGVLATTFQSDTIITSSSIYVENGSALSWTMQTSLLPDNGDMCENALVQSTVAMALLPGTTVTVEAGDDLGNVLGTAVITAPGAAPLWGGVNWGAFNWGANTISFRQYRVPWAQPLVYKQATQTLTGSSAAGTRIGNSYFQHQNLGYVLA